MAAENYDTVMRLLADDKMSPEVKKALGNLGDLERRMVSTARTSKKSLLDMGMSFTKFGKNLAFFGGALEAPILLATRAAESFEQSMFKVNRTLGKSPEELKSYGDEVKKLSLETGKMPGDLATGLDAALRAGFDASGALKVTGQGAKLAVGGAIELTDSMKLLTGAMSEYHTRATDVNKISDQFMLAQKGRTDLTVLAGGMKDVAGQAEAVGVKLPEVLAYITSMQKQGETTGESMENLKTLLGMMGKVPIAKNRGMLAWLNTLGTVSKTNRKAFALMFESPEQAASIKKTIDGMKGLTEEIRKFNSVGNSGTVTQTAFEERSKTATEQLNKLKAETGVLAIDLGTMLTPAVIRQVQAMTSLVEIGIKFSAKHPELSKGILDTAATMASLAVATGTAAFTFGKLLTMLQKLGKIGGVLGITGAGAATAGLVAAPVVAAAALSQTMKTKPGDLAYTKYGGFAWQKPVVAKKKNMYEDMEVIGVLSDPMQKVVENNQNAMEKDLKNFMAYLRKKEGIAKTEEYIAPLFLSDMPASNRLTNEGAGSGAGAPVSNHFNRIERVELHNVNGIEDLMHELSLIAESA